MCLLLTACAPEVADEAKSLSEPNSYFTFDGISFSSTPNAAAPFGLDPIAAGWLWATDLPENLFAAGGRNYDIGLDDYSEFARLDFYNPYILLNQTRSYPIVPPPVATPPADDSAFFIYNEALSNTQCEATGGAATITGNAPPGDYFTGEYTVTGWQAGGTGVCTLGAPKSGTFLIKRGADDRDENDGQMIDTLAVYDDSVLTANMTENNTTPNDPLLAAEYDALGGLMTLRMSMLADRPNGIYQRDFYIEYSGGAGTFVTPGSGFGLIVSYDSGGVAVTCPATTGTLNIASEGPVGGQVVGNLISVGITPTAGCPSTIDINFTATRLADF